MTIYGSVREREGEIKLVKVLTKTQKWINSQLNEQQLVIKQLKTQRSHGDEMVSLLLMSHNAYTRIVSVKY